MPLLSGLRISEKTILSALWRSGKVLSYLEKPWLCCERIGLLMFSNLNAYLNFLKFLRNSQVLICRFYVEE